MISFDRSTPSLDRKEHPSYDFSHSPKNWLTTLRSQRRQMKQQPNPPQQQTTVSNNHTYHKENEHHNHSPKISNPAENNHLGRGAKLIHNPGKQQPKRTGTLNITLKDKQGQQQQHSHRQKPNLVINTDRKLPPTPTPPLTLDSDSEIEASNRSNSINIEKNNNNVNDLNNQKVNQGNSSDGADNDDDDDNKNKGVQEIKEEEYASFPSLNPFHAIVVAVSNKSPLDIPSDRILIILNIGGTKHTISKATLDRLPISSSSGLVSFIEYRFQREYQKHQQRKSKKQDHYLNKYKQHGNSSRRDSSFLQLNDEEEEDQDPKLMIATEEKPIKETGQDQVEDDEQDDEQEVEQERQYRTARIFSKSSLQTPTSNKSVSDIIEKYQFTEGPLMDVIDRLPNLANAFRSAATNMHDMSSNNNTAKSSNPSALFSRCQGIEPPVDVPKGPFDYAHTPLKIQKAKKPSHPVVVSRDPLESLLEQTSKEEQKATLDNSLVEVDNLDNDNNPDSDLDPDLTPRDSVIKFTDSLTFQDYQRFLDEQQDEFCSRCVSTYSQLEYDDQQQEHEQDEQEHEHEQERQQNTPSFPSSPACSASSSSSSSSLFVWSLEIFIDRDPSPYSSILHWMRYSSLPACLRVCDYIKSDQMLNNTTSATWVRALKMELQDIAQEARWLGIHSLTQVCDNEISLCHLTAAAATTVPDDK